MPDQSPNSLEFEKSKWRDEFKLRREEHELKLKQLSRSGWKSPIVVAIAAAALAAASNGALSFLDSRQQRILEDQRAVAQFKLEDRKAEAARVLEMIKSGDPSAVRNNLRFLVDAGLIKDGDLSARLTKYLGETPNDRIPRLPQQFEGSNPSSRQLHVLAVGIGDYKSATIPSLQGPERDARDVGIAAIMQNGGLYANASSSATINADATKNGIIEAIKRLRNRASVANGDVALIHFSGHAHANGGEFYLVPHDAALATNSKNWKDSLISTSEIGDLLAQLTKSTYVIVSIDACPSGSYTSPDKTLSGKRLTVIVASFPGIMCADTIKPNGNGALTTAIIEILSGLGDLNGDGGISVEELNQYAIKRVAEITKGKQIVTASTGFNGIVFQAAKNQLAIEDKSKR